MMMIELQTLLRFLVLVSASPPKNDDRITDLTSFLVSASPPKNDDRISDLTSFFRSPFRRPRQKTMIELQISLPFLGSVSASPPKIDDRITDLTSFFGFGVSFPAKNR